jgi:hypothetical protein
MAKVPEQMADGKRTYPKKINVPLFFKKKYNHLAVYMVHVMCCTVVYKHWKKKKKWVSYSLFFSLVIFSSIVMKTDRLPWRVRYRR